MTTILRQRVFKPVLYFALMMVAVMAGSGLLQAPKPASAATMVPLSIVYYGSHDSVTDQRIINARPGMLITNTPAGYWHGNADPAKFQAQGIRVFSYIYANYDQFPLAQNQALIDAIARETTDGIFVDMVNPSATPYNQALYSYAKSRGLSVIINPGMPYVDASIYSVADYVMTDEHYTGRNPTAVEAAHLNQTIVIGFNSGWTAQQAASYTNAAWAKGFAYSWHEQIEYMALPSWFEQYVSLLSPNAALPPPPSPTPTPAPAPVPPPTTSPAPAGTVTGSVASAPSPSGGANEYNLSLKIASTTDPRFTVGQNVWCAATTANFPNLLSVGSTLTGTLDYSLGWWVFKKASASVPSPSPLPIPAPSPAPTGAVTGSVASVPSPSGGANEYNLSLRITSTTDPRFTVGQNVWCAATTTNFSNLLNGGATLTGDLDYSLGWWVLK